MADEFVTLDQAAKLVGVSRATLWRRLKDESIQTYQSQQDRRVRLVRRDDLEVLLGPKPVVVHTPVLEDRVEFSELAGLGKKSKTAA